MERKYSGRIPTMKGPASYKICVHGLLDVKWSDRLGGMNITTSGGGGARDITILEGRVQDQTALSGILNTLHDLHMPVLSLECIDAE